jgi:hypothetical protein
MPSKRPRRNGAATEAATERNAVEPTTALRRLALIGVLSGLAAVIPYAETIPWLELQTLVVFAAGYLLGSRSGALIGAVAMGFYSLANPQGMAHPLVFGSQVLGRGLVGAMGGWAHTLKLPTPLGLRSVALAAWALASSLAYDLITNVASGLVYGQMIPSLVMGIPWALAHMASNVVFFVLVGVPLFRLLDVRRGQLVACAVIAACTFPVASAGAQPAADSTSVPPADSIAIQPADTSMIAPQPADSVATPGDSLVVPLRALPPAATPAADWRLVVEPGAAWRRGTTDSDDALTLLANAPRFYGDAGSVEPLRFSALPGGWEIGSRDGIPQWVRSTPWQDPSRLSEGSKGAWSWSPLGRPAAIRVPEPLSPVGKERRDAGTGLESEPGWDGSSIEPRQGRPLTSLWVGTGSFTRRTQGFNLQLFESVAGIPWRIGWSAWTRRVGPLGEFSQTGAHGSEITLGGRGRTWRWESVYQTNRTSTADRYLTIHERRPLQQGWTRFDWRQRPEGGNYAGGAVSIMGEQTTGETTTDLDLRRKANQYAASVWGGSRRTGWEYGAMLSWTRQAVTIGLRERIPNPVPQPPTIVETTVYDPDDLDVFALTLEARARGSSGSWHAAVTVEEASGVTSVMPRLGWRGGGRSTGFYANAGGMRATTLAEAGKLGDPLEGAEVERPNGWIGVLGFRHVQGGPHDERIEEPVQMKAALGGGELRLQLSATAWTLEEVLFPAYGLFARTILEEPAVTANVDGGALTGRIEWAPLLGLELGFTGYAAAREVPTGAASAAPDYRAMLVLGPRFRLFASTLEVAIQLEADHIGPRVAADGELSAITRLGGRLILNLGDAWLVIRGTDLDDSKYLLPGSGNGGSLRSPGRQIRLYGEWRLLD